MKKTFLILVATLACFYVASAQKIADSFQAFLKSSPTYSCIAQGLDGNFFISGDFDFYENSQSGRIVKFDASGKRIDSFKPVVANRNIEQIVPLSDGKIIIHGNFTSVYGKPAWNLARLTSAGDLDESFSATAADPIGNFRIQSDGKIIISGLRADYSQWVKRLNANGSPDETFSEITTGFLSISPPELAIGQNDNILAGDVFRIRKFDKNGNPDADFSVFNAGDSYIENFAVQPDGKILVLTSEYITLSPYTEAGTLVRLLEDGTPDPGFAAVELRSESSLLSTIVIKSNGNVIVGGQIDQCNGQQASVIEFNPDGTLKTIITDHNNNPTNLFVGSDSHLFVLGTFLYINGGQQLGVARIKPDLTVDTNFKLPLYRSPFTNYITGEVQRDGKLLISHLYGLFENSNEIGITRLNSDGSKDPTFNPNLILEFNSRVDGFTLQADQKIIVYGYKIYHSPLTGTRNIVRLLPDGTTDETFAIGVGAQFNSSHAPISSIRTNKGKIYILGLMDSFNGTACKSLVILNESGSLIGTPQGIPDNSYFQDMEIQSDGKIVLLGDFSPPGASVPRQMIRLNSDGSLDDTFVVKDCYNLLDVCIDANDRIYVSGTFTSFNGTTISNFVRLNSDGTVDQSFSSGAAITGNEVSHIVSMKLLNSGNIFLGGYFDKVNNTPSSGIALLKPEGELIPVQSDLTPESSVLKVIYGNNTVYAVGRLIFGDGGRISSAAKILFDIEGDSQPLVATPLGASTIQLEWSEGFPGAEETTIERSENNPNGFELIATLGPGSTSYENTDLESGTLYHYRVQGRNEFYTGDPITSSAATLVVGLAEQATQDVYVYPNPVSRSVRIQSLNNEGGNFTIYSTSGTEQLSKHLSPGGNADLDLGSWQDGIYFLKVKFSSSPPRTIKLIKQN